MDTSVLKNFAAETRRELAQGVAARLDAVLMRGSNERLDFPVLVGKLEQAIAESSREAVIERVTYLWFNRLVAMRFMDARGYSPVGVVSPAEGANPMQAPPQVVSDAFAGMIDENIVKSFGVAGKIRDIVNGVARSQDPYSDVFALLVDEYAQHFQTWVPAMFPEADDVSNLLLPANLLAAHSVVRKIAQTMTVEMCQDVEVIGWLYQFYIAERKDEVFDGFKKGKKAGAAEIPAATQLFTPNWIVRYLVQNTVGRTWLLNNPGSALRGQMEYFVEPVGGLDSVQDFVRISSPEELTVLDPAVGSGHMLTYAFDLLYEMYCEAGYAEAEIPGLILAKNLVGVELDERAGALAAFALTMKARERYRRFLRPNRVVAPQICVLQKVSFTGEELRSLGEGFDFAADHAVDSGLVQVDADVFAGFWNQFESADVFGSLIRPDAAVLQVMREHVEAFVGEADAEPGLLLDELAELREKARLVLRQAELLSSTYVAVVANPPYMGSKNMSPMMTAWLKENYPDTAADLMTAFMERAETLGEKSAYWGMIDLPSWMFLSSFKNYRAHLLKDLRVTTLAHLGRGIFGSDFGSVAFIVQNSEPSEGTTGIYRKLYDQHVEVRSVEVIRQRFFAEAETQFVVKQVDLLKVPDQALSYWLPGTILENFQNSPAISSIADAKQGIITGNNERFIRYWYEVNNSKIKRDSLDREDACVSGAKWFPHPKGGNYNKWSGNNDLVVNWENDGFEIINFKDKVTGKRKSRPQNLDFIFREGITWGTLSSSSPSFRYSPAGAIANAKGSILFPRDSENTLGLLGFLNSSTASYILASIAPTVDFTEGSISKLPTCTEVISSGLIKELVSECIEISDKDLANIESSHTFSVNPIVSLRGGTIEGSVDRLRKYNSAQIGKLKENEQEINKIVSRYYFGDPEEIDNSVSNKSITLNFNSEYYYGDGSSTRMVKDLISYFVGVLFGRYSLDTPGLIIANQGETLADYLAKAGTDAPTFIPDEDNVIPVLADDRFDDDIVAKFRAFLKKAFGEENLEINLTYIEATLGKSVRKYFTDDFYKDHLKRYSKRPIYWMFSSTGNGKGSFKALVYMHRYTPATVSTVLNDYLRPYMDKLTANREHLQYTIAHGQGREATRAQKEDDALAKTLKELTDYQDSVLYPLAVKNIHIDLDNGVAHNYSLLGKALHSI
ncbi:BREX-1 system adenine-specific DNA-methyltransferase PglX [Rothia nasimurium]|uniref:BREX-1 system adenine-specific DNA-methyltransferase PglX n=1 Tax=Rothia nasimurium TaxID=85336 RepID=UPI001F026ECE|nr:BREX-1 system adenine-specific DNA-methyltransferase PglX [Rothia nasimurium]